MIRKQTRGFTIVEVLVASVILAFIMVGVYGLMTTFSKETVFIAKRTEAELELDNVLSDIQRVFKRRIADNNELAEPPVELTAGALCSGLLVRQRMPDGSVREVRFESQCENDGTVAAGESIPNPLPTTACTAPEVAKFVKTVDGVVEKSYPSRQIATSGGLCVESVSGGLEIILSSGMVVRTRKTFNVFKRSDVLIATDRSPEVEFVQ